MLFRSNSPSQITQAIQPETMSINPDADHHLVAVMDVEFLGYSQELPKLMWLAKQRGLIRLDPIFTFKSPRGRRMLQALYCGVLRKQDQSLLEDLLHGKKSPSYLFHVDQDGCHQNQASEQYVLRVAKTVDASVDGPLPAFFLNGRLLQYRAETLITDVEEAIKEGDIRCASLNAYF